MEYWTALILGLAGSLHCAGMCGPLALALPTASGSWARMLAGRFAYHAGRTCTYCVLGLLFGLFGKTLYLAGLQQWVSLGLGGLLFLGLLSSRKLTSWLPVIALVAWLKARMSGLLRQRSVSSLALLGLLNGLLPCGLVYVACAGATATGNIGSGAIYMTLFGIGTTPLLLAIGLSGNLMPVSLRLKLRQAVPVMVFILAALLIMRGLALGIPYLSPDLGSGSSCCSHKLNVP